jgi:hypothetical protein
MSNRGPSSFLPNLNDINGGAHFSLDFTDVRYKGLSVSSTLFKTHWKDLDQPSVRCDSKAKSPNMTSCIIKYIQSRLGCEFSFWGTPMNLLPTCNTTEQYGELTKLVKSIQYMNEAKLFNMTGTSYNSTKNNQYYLPLILYVQLGLRK